jgi:hypothetical protein
MKFEDEASLKRKEVTGSLCVLLDYYMYVYHSDYETFNGVLCLVLEFREKWNSIDGTLMLPRDESISSS